MGKYFENLNNQEEKEFTEFSADIIELIGKHHYVKLAVCDLRNIEDETTLNHSIKTAECASWLCGREIFAHFSEQEREHFILAALLHDLGKKKLDPELLKKKDLISTEKEKIDNHARIAFEKIKDKNPRVAEIIVMHHEFQDKTPNGHRQNGKNGNENNSEESYNKKRKEVEPATASLAARLAIIDAFHGMIDPRRKYRPAPLAPEEAKIKILENPKISGEDKKIMEEVANYFAKYSV